MDEVSRAGIQCDGAECFLQLALFEPGKELLEQHPEALDALRALADGGGALASEASLAAGTALAALEGPAPGPVGDQKHVMVSCACVPQISSSQGCAEFVMLADQWDVQVIIQRLVSSLQTRGYAVWFGAHLL